MIIFLYGEDDFRSQRKLAEIKNKFILSDKSAAGLSVFECGENVSATDKDIIGNIINVIGTPNLLAPKRLLIIKNAINNLSVEERKELLDFLKKNKNNLIENKDQVIVFWEDGQPKKSNAIFKFLDSNEIKKQNCAKLTGKKLEGWILKTLMDIDKSAKISFQALEKLIIFSNSNSRTIYLELKKLVGFTQGKMIEGKDVDLLVHASLDMNIFQMVDALGRGDKKEALKLLHDHMEKGDDPFYLFSMFFYQFRNMLKVADLFDRGIQLEKEISNLTKLHPFVVKKSLAQIRQLPLNKLKKIYKELIKLDMDVKTGRIEIGLGLDKFVAEL